MSHFLNLSLLFTLVACLLTTVSCQKDDTVKDRATGKDVVEAVLRKIERSQIFPQDHTFLLRLAYVESHFGADNHTFLPNNYYGGIWQVNESYFNQTKNASLVGHHQQILTRFNVAWGNVTWRNLNTPLHSGLAAALYFRGIDLRDREPIPQTIATQAAHWKKHYRYEKNVAEFTDASEELKNLTTCRGKMDLCIVLDSSGSINQGPDKQNYQRAKNFTADMIQSFTLDFTRIGMLVYSNVVEDIFPIRNNLTISQMAQLARNARYLDSGTQTDAGILRAIQMFNASGSTEGVPKILVVFTDGNSDSLAKLRQAVQQIRNNNITSLAVGIGRNINRNELLLIALDNPNSVFQLADFSSLQDFLSQLTSVTCEVPQKPAINGTYKDDLLQNEKRIYHIRLPAKGLSISIDVTLGTPVGYWSLTEEVPSAAINDGTLGGWTYIPAPAVNANQADTTVYVSIQGLAKMNNYTISAKEGRVDEPTTTTTTTTEAGAGTVGLSSVLVLIISLTNFHFV